MKGSQSKVEALGFRDSGFLSELTVFGTWGLVAQGEEFRALGALSLGFRSRALRGFGL